MAEIININNQKNITDFLAKQYDKGKNPIYAPIPPHNYEGRQVIINADRLVFNARLATDQGEAASYSAGGDIHMFSQNFISLSTRGSIHLNTLHPKGVAQEENNINYIMINAPNIFLGMDDVPEVGEDKPISYPTEPAVLGLKNQEFMDHLLNFLHVILQRLSCDNVYITGAPGEESQPMKETWEDLILDDPSNPDKWSIGGLRALLRNIKSNHVFIKK